MLMAQALIPCWNWMYICILESSQAEGSHVGDLLYLYSVLYPKEGVNFRPPELIYSGQEEEEHFGRGVTQPSRC